MIEKNKNDGETRVSWYLKEKIFDGETLRKLKRQKDKKQIWITVKPYLPNEYVNSNIFFQTTIFETNIGMSIRTLPRNMTRKKQRPNLVRKGLTGNKREMLEPILMSSRI